MKAIILARVSSKEQEEGHSLDAQVTRLVEYAAKKNLDVIKEFVLIESSTQGQRKKFKDVIEFCKAEKETVAIIVDAVDRLQRSFKETVTLNELIEKNKIELHFYRENLIIARDTTPSNIMIWNIHVMLAQSYVLQLSENVKRSINHKIRNGEWSGKAPIGYLNTRDEYNKSHIYLDPERAPIIKKLFQEYSKGGSNFKDLAKLAYKWGLRSNTPSQKRLSPGTLYDVLCNPFYYGEMLVKGKLYPHKYENLVSKDLWEAAEAVRLGYNKKPFKHSEKEFLYRGLMTCARTGKVITTELKKKIHTYLVCFENEEKRKYIKEDEVTAQIYKVLKSIKIPDKILTEINSYLKESKKAEIEFNKESIKKLRMGFDRATDRINSLLNLYIDGKIEEDIYNLKMESLKEEKADLGRKISEHSNSDDKFNETLVKLFTLANRSAEFFAKTTNFEEKREVIKFVFRTLTLDCGKLGYALNTPFVYMQEIAQNSKWRPQHDSNVRPTA